MAACSHTQNAGDLQQSDYVLRVALAKQGVIWSIDNIFSACCVLFWLTLNNDFLGDCLAAFHLTLTNNFLWLFAARSSLQQKEEVIRKAGTLSGIRNQLLCLWSANYVLRVALCKTRPCKIGIRDELWGRTSFSSSALAEPHNRIQAVLGSYNVWTFTRHWLILVRVTWKADVSPNYANCSMVSRRTIHFLALAINKKGGLMPPTI